MASFSWKIRVLILFGLIAFDVAVLRNEYLQTKRLPFLFPNSIEEKISQVLPPPTPAPTPMEQQVEFSNGQWVGSIVYGKITNHNSFPIINPELFFTLSSSKDESNYIDSFTATVAAKIDPEKSVYFSQRFQTPGTESFWWSAVVSKVASFSGQPLPKTPKGQQVSTKVITPPIAVPKSPVSKDPWGVAKQIDDVTWTIKLGQDDRMATPQETLQALNQYRNTHGSASLTWDDNLAVFASNRAKYLNSIQSTDEHKGFKDYVNNEDNLKKLGFWSVGENSGYGHKLLGVHLIEWVYASDPGHNENQLSKAWSHVGIGIEGLAVVFIFGGDKI